MRIKTSISLSEEILKQLGRYASGGERSEFIEKALWSYLEGLRRAERDRADLDRINAAASYLNEAAEDTLGYQAPL